MNLPHDDEPWIERARALLDQSADNLDASTLLRLNRARQAALAERRGRSHRWMWSAGLAGAMAAALAIGVGLQHRADAPNASSSTGAPLQAGDIDFLTSDDDTLDLYENLDFYAWLETQPAGPNG